MILDADDFRPRSLLERRPLDRQQLAGGGTLASAIPFAFGVLYLVYAAADAVGLVPPPVEAAPPPVENVVAARFVVLGRELMPNELPDRLVPILRTDTPEPRDAPSLEDLPDPEPPPEREEPRRRDAVDDALRRLSEDAQMFAERAEEREREGSPDGIEEGTERTGTEGDLYRGRLYTFFRRGWSVPTTLSEEELAALTCTVMVEIAADTRIIGFRISRPSGDAEFDASVEAQLTRIRSSEPNIPAPPEEVSADYLGREIAIQFHGRNARR
jgi:hypothetical protein